MRCEQRKIGVAVPPMESDEFDEASYTVTLATGDVAGGGSEAACTMTARTTAMMVSNQQCECGDSVCVWTKC